MGRLVTLTLVLAVLACAVTAELTVPLLEEEAAALVQLAESTQKKDGSFGSPAAAQQAVSVFLGLGKEVPQKDSVCKYLKKQLDSVSSITDVYHCVVGMDKLDCSSAVPAKVSKTILSTLEDSAATLEEAYFALTSALSLKKAGLLEVDDSKLAALAGRVAALLEADGTFAASAKNSAASALNAGYAYDILGFLVKKIDGDKTVEKHALAVVDTIKEFVDDHVVDDRLSFSEGGETPTVKATAVVFKGLNNLVKQVKKKKKSGVQDAHVEMLAEFFLDRTAVTTVEDAYYLVMGLKSISDNFFYVPVVFSLLPRTQTGGKGDSMVVVSVTNVLGEPATKAAVLLNSATTRDGTVLQSNVELAPVAPGDKNTQFQFVFYDGKMDNGLFDFDFRLTLEGKKYKSEDSVKRSVKVASTASIANLEVALTQGPNELESFRPKKGKKVASKLQLSKNTAVSIKFNVKGASGKPVTPHQTFVIFHCAATGRDVTLVAVLKDGSYVVKLDFARSAMVEAFKGQSGDYTVTLVVGDAVIRNSLVWELFDAAVSIGEPKEQWNPLRELSPKADIVHTFREPERRAPLVVSLAFAGITAFPLVVSALGYLRVGGMPTNVPVKGLGFPNFVLFFGSFIAIFALYGAFFVFLNMVQTLKLLAPLALITTYFGKRALGDLARAREEETAESKKKN